MPVVCFSSPKEGAGKTTAATLFATEVARAGASVTIIDADPNKNVADWARLPGLPETITVVSDISEEGIVDAIEAASAKTAFVIVDLEGTASLMVSYAISMADFVVIPVQGSQLDAKQAARQIRLIQAQEKVTRRSIPFAVLFTRSNPAITPKTQRHIEESFTAHGIPMFRVRLYDREAYRAIFSFGGSLASLEGKGVSNLTAAKTNAHAFASELIARLKGEFPDTEQEKDVA